MPGRRGLRILAGARLNCLGVLVPIVRPWTTVLGVLRHADVPESTRRTAQARWHLNPNFRIPACQIPYLWLNGRLTIPAWDGI